MSYKLLVGISPNLQFRCSRQGWARDVKAGDRDIGFTGRDETLKFRDETFVALET